MPPYSADDQQHLGFCWLIIFIAFSSLEGLSQFFLKFIDLSIVSSIHKDGEGAMFSHSECGSCTAQGRAKVSSRAHILSLPVELLYDILDYLPVADVVSFVFCRWDFFLASTDFLKHEIGPSLKNLETLTKLFMRYPWPKRWLQCIIQRAISDEPPILRDIDSLMAVHARNLLPEDVFRVTVRNCTEYNSPILDSWITCDHMKRSVIT
jgi:hypothetical protein